MSEQTTTLDAASQTAPRIYGSDVAAWLEVGAWMRGVVARLGPASDPEGRWFEERKHEGAEEGGTVILWDDYKVAAVAVVAQNRANRLAVATWEAARG